MSDSGEFTAHLRQRIRAAAQSLTEARAAHDDYLVDVRMGELESLRRLAAANYVDLDDAGHGDRGGAAGVVLDADAADVTITIPRPVPTASPAA